MLATIDQNPGTSREAIAAHYDVGEGFYRLWLDSTRTFTCALWDEAESLEQAQLDKIDYHIVQAGAAGARRVLDIGCGWGSAMRRMVEHHGVERAVGLTLSLDEFDAIQSIDDEAIEVHLESWSDHAPPVPYDAIVSVGAFEHCARPDAAPETKINAYRSFFGHCHGLLKPHGLMSLQTICYEGTTTRRELSTSVCMDAWDETEFPRLAEIAEAVEGTFELVQLRNDREDYVQTFDEWIRRIERARAEAERLVGEEVVARFEKWLRLSRLGFRTARMGLLRMTLRRRSGLQTSR